MKKGKKLFGILLVVLCLSVLCFAACGTDKGDNGDASDPSDPSPHAHTMTHVPQVDATCTQNGVKEYWQCGGCNKTFADENGTAELTDLTIAASGHSMSNGICSACGYATGTEGLGYTEDADGNAYIATGMGECTSAEIVIASEHLGKPVTGIAENAFENCNTLTKVTIGNGVTSIGNSAFRGCSALTSVTIPNSVTIIWGLAFRSCSALTSITIPDSVTSIGLGAFRGCSALTSITIPDGVTSIGNNAFEECGSLEFNEFDNAWYLGNAGNPYSALISAKNTRIDACTIHGQTKVIADWAFKNGTGLQSVAIPDGVTSIGSSAFNGCRNLSLIAIPGSVTSIGSSAFEGCSVLAKVDYTGTIAQWCGITFGNGFANPIKLTHKLHINDAVVANAVIPDTVTEIKAYAFYGCTSLASVTIPNSVTSIGVAAFDSCTSLASVTIPNSVTSIGGSAFYGCTGFTSVTIPDSVTSIGGSAFEGCTGLTSVTIPSGVTRIGSSAFSSCTILARVNYGGTIAQWCGITFGNAYANPLYYANGPYIADALPENLVIPDTVTEIKAYAFFNCGSLTSVTIPSGVTKIGDSAFHGCGNLSVITIPSSVTEIGEKAFENCNGLTRVNYTGTLVQWCGISFGSSYANPLYYAHKLYIADALLENLVIPDTVTTINDYAFCGCSSLTSITIPNGVTKIGNGAFAGCSNFTSITIPSSVTEIGRGAFSGCSRLSSVTFVNRSGWKVFIGTSGTAITINDPVSAAMDLKDTYADYAWKRILN